mmetsp:Transcript_21273/g.34226  ORF Transcript_21273/g.34226 Transcript_21273/m.34226 type:complete len:80 (-) Transcript_21273:579-818(-)
MLHYLDNVTKNGLLKKYWGIPVQGATFGVIPEHFRTTFMASISFFWVVILSCLSSRSSVAARSDRQDLSNSPNSTAASY